MTPFQENETPGDTSSHNRRRAYSSLPKDANAWPEKPVTERRWLRKLSIFSLVMVAFLAGLLLGLREDVAAEHFVLEAGSSLFGEPLPEQNPASAFLGGSPDIQVFGGANPSGASFTHAFAEWDREYSKHFRERVDCRKISNLEIENVLERGSIFKFWPDNENKSNGNLEPKFNVVAETEPGRQILISFICPPDRPRTIVLITAYPLGDRNDGC